MSGSKKEIILESGERVTAWSPVVISASRATDIPAFYMEWFWNCLEKGYSVWTNPFTGGKSYVSYQEARLFVFWSKNPLPLLDYVARFDRKNWHYYLHFTLNDYEKEGLERGVPPLEERIDTFRRCAEKMGLGKVIWRFDPIILTDKIGKDDLLEKVWYIGERLKGYTEKMVFSFADIGNYRKVRNNLNRNHIHYRDFTWEDIDELVQGIVGLNAGWNYELATCSEKMDLEAYGVRHNKCVDDDLIVRFWSEDRKLMEYLGIETAINGDLFNPGVTLLKKKNNKDRGQRPLCGCIKSKDIGTYNTCPHLCDYCYANISRKTVLANYRKYLEGREDGQI